MSNKCKLWFLMAATVLSLALVASSVSAAEKKPSEDKVAVVNGVAIPRGDFDRDMRSIQKRSHDIGKQTSNEQLSKIKKDILENLINGELLYQESRKEGIKVSEDEINEQLAGIKKRFPDETKFQNVLSEANLSEQTLKTQIERGEAIQKFVDKKFMRAVIVSNEESKAYYDENPNYFKKPEEVRASHILIKVKPQAGESEKKEARKKLKKIKGRLKKGEDFAALAKEFSEGPSSANGGDLGYFKRGQMVKPFEEKAFAMKPGEVSDIVETRFGYHLIKVIDKKPETVTAYEEVKDRLGNYLKQEKVRKEVGRFVEQLKEKSKIERFLPEAPE